MVKYIHITERWSVLVLFLVFFPQQKYSVTKFFSILTHHITNALEDDLMQHISKAKIIHSKEFHMDEEKCLTMTVVLTGFETRLCFCKHDHVLLPSCFNHIISYIHVHICTHICVSNSLRFCGRAWNITLSSYNVSCLVLFYLGIWASSDISYLSYTASLRVYYGGFNLSFQHICCLATYSMVIYSMVEK